MSLHDPKSAVAGRSVVIYEADLTTLRPSVIAERRHGSLLSLLASKRHVLHAGENGRIIARVGCAGSASARSWSSLLTVGGTTSGRVGGGRWIAAVVGTVAGPRWIVSAVVHGTTTSSHVWVASSKSTVASVHLLCILLSLCPGRHTVSCLRSIGRQLMRESVVAVVVVVLRCVITTAT